MRIVDQIEHPIFKISIFKNDNRYSVKLENAHFEQTYKMKEIDHPDPVGFIRTIVSPEFCRQAEAIAAQMHKNYLQSTAILAKNDEEYFEEII